MSIRYKCPKCRTKLVNPDSGGEQKDTCPMCGHVHLVPSSKKQKKNHGKNHVGKKASIEVIAEEPESHSSSNKETDTNTEFSPENYLENDNKLSAECSCGAEIKVHKRFAGKQGKCPDCGKMVRIPNPWGKSVVSSEENPSKAPIAELVPVSDHELQVPDPVAMEIFQREQTQWFYVIAGQRHGPVDTTTLADMLTHGGLDGFTTVWKNGMATWEPVGSIPELAGYLQQALPPSAPSQSIPVSQNFPVQQKQMASHRGGTILIFGLLGLFCCIIFGISAWTMGSSDLQKMDAGLMDSTGRGSTQAGKICGMISVILGIIGFVFYLMGSGV